MIPSVLASQLITGVKDFLTTTFPSSTPAFFDMMKNFVEEDGKLFKGPYVSVALPFKKGVASISMISNSKVVPFGISGDYKFRSKPTIEFGKAIDFKEESIGKEEADNYLQEKVKNLIRK